MNTQINQTGNATQYCPNDKNFCDMPKCFHEGNSRLNLNQWIRIEKVKQKVRIKITLDILSPKIKKPKSLWKRNFGTSHNLITITDSLSIAKSG